MNSSSGAFRRLFSAVLQTKASSRGRRPILPALEDFSMAASQQVDLKAQTEERKRLELGASERFKAAQVFGWIGSEPTLSLQTPGNRQVVLAPAPIKKTRASCSDNKGRKPKSQRGGVLLLRGRRERMAEWMCNCSAFIHHFLLLPPSLCIAT